MVLDEAHADHDGSPKQSDGGKVDAWADGADNDRRGKLEDDVREEEDEIGNVLHEHVSNSQL